MARRTLALDRSPASKPSRSRSRKSSASCPSPWRPKSGRRAPDRQGALRSSLETELLTGRPVGSNGKVACPFHEDEDPSLHAYAEPERGWTCYGSGRGGTIIDFGVALYGIEPRRQGFHEIRRRVTAALLGRAAA